MLIRNCLSVLSLLAALGAAAEGVIGSAAELRHVFEERIAEQPFEMDVTFVGLHKGLLFEDATGGMFAETTPSAAKSVQQLVPGDRLHIAGQTFVVSGDRYIVQCRETTRLGPGPAPAPRDITGLEFVSGRFDYSLVRLTGTVWDAVVDDIDPQFTQISLDCDGHNILFAMPSLPELRDMIGAKIRITGLCDPTPSMRRDFVGRMLSMPSDIQILARPAGDIFDVPDLLRLRRQNPDTLIRLGRHRVCGRVLATWHGNCAIVGVTDGRKNLLVKTDFVTASCPHVGDGVEVSGFVGTDLYGYTLTRADWRPATGVPPFEHPATERSTIRDLFANDRGQARFHPFLTYRPVTVRGVVRSAPDPAISPRLVLEDAGVALQVDVGACSSALPQDLSGCTVDVTGYLIPDVDNWSPHNVFPQMRELFVTVGRAEDIAVVARPPWWTPQRLLMLLGLMAGGLLAILLWNRALGRKVERRSRELLDEQIAHVASDLKTMERTRLAIELHDSISQNLAGVALEMQTVRDTLNDDAAFAAQHLDVANRSLTSCREELRNCLRDLRSDALEIADVNEAIRLTLAPHVGDTDVSIRFNVPREGLTDNTMHALLRIIRELVQNAIRHGKARTVRVAGAIDGGRLLFSVADDGCGFDPAACPGVPEGHFGLQGIQDRIDGFEGNMAIDSKPGNGTKVTIALKLPKEDSSCNR